MRYLKDISRFVKNKVVFVGMDVHKKDWSLCFFCDGEVVEQLRMLSRYELLRQRLVNTYSSAREIRLVYEAGFSGFWLYRCLLGDGYDCIVTPPALIPQSTSKVKTDRRDARQLARLLSADLLKSVYVPPAAIEADRRVVRYRAALVKKVTGIKNTISSLLHLHGLEKPATIKTRWSGAYINWLSSLILENDSDRWLLDQQLMTLRWHRDQLAAMTRRLRELSKRSDYREMYERVSSARGVGLITAMTFILEIYDFGRFKTVKAFNSYLGMTPAQYSSGEQTRLGHITRQGNAHLRRVLVESAWTVIRHDQHLRAKYERLKSRGSNGKKAIVAVARSLAVRLRRCLLDGVDYDVAMCG